MLENGRVPPFSMQIRLQSHKIIIENKHQGSKSVWATSMSKLCKCPQGLKVDTMSQAGPSSLFDWQFHLIIARLRGPSKHTQGWDNRTNSRLGESSSIEYPSEAYLLTQISRKFFCPLLIIHVLNRFEILHRARQWYCRALCKMSKRSGFWNGYYEQTTFRKKDEFRMEIVYCNTPLVCGMKH